MRLTGNLTTRSHVDIQLVILTTTRQVLPKVDLNFRCLLTVISQGTRISMPGRHDTLVLKVDSLNVLRPSTSGLIKGISTWSDTF